MDRMLFNSDVTKLRNDAQNLQPEKYDTDQEIIQCYSSHQMHSVVTL